MLAAGVPAQDPDIRKACLYLKVRQRNDGGWGEQPASALEGRYVEASSSHVVQTAWAMGALLLAKDPDWEAVDRAARFLGRAQRAQGDWAEEAPVWVLPGGTLGAHQLHRLTYPVWALGLYEQRRAQRQALLDERSASPVAG